MPVVPVKTSKLFIVVVDPDTDNVFVLMVKTLDVIVPFTLKTADVAPVAYVKVAFVTDPTPQINDNVCATLEINDRPDPDEIDCSIRKFCDPALS